MTDQVQHISKRTLEVIEYAGLLVITLATLVASAQEIMTMVGAGRVTLADLLLLFIYLEVIAMVGVYLDSGKMPVRMPLYIAIVALARYLALDMKSMDSWEIIAVAGAILVLAAAALLIRYGRQYFPNPPGDSGPWSNNRNKAKAKELKQD